MTVKGHRSTYSSSSSSSSSYSFLFYTRPVCLIDDRQLSLSAVKIECKEAVIETNNGTRRQTFSFSCPTSVWNLSAIIEIRQTVLIDIYCDCLRCVRIYRVLLESPPDGSDLTVDSAGDCVKNQAFLGKAPLVRPVRFPGITASFMRYQSPPPPPPPRWFIHLSADDRYLSTAWMAVRYPDEFHWRCWFANKRLVGFARATQTALVTNESIEFWSETGCSSHHRDNSGAAVAITHEAAGTS